MKVSWMYIFLLSFFLSIFLAFIFYKEKLRVTIYTNAYLGVVFFSLLQNINSFKKRMGISDEIS